MCIGFKLDVKLPQKEPSLFKKKGGGVGEGGKNTAEFIFKYK